jgi:hypothetical protein
VKRLSRENKSSDVPFWGFHSSDYGEYGLLGCNVVWFERCPELQTNISSTSIQSSYRLLLASFLVGLQFVPEDGDDVIFRNVLFFPDVHGVTIKNSALSQTVNGNVFSSYEEQLEIYLYWEDTRIEFQSNCYLSRMIMFFISPVYFIFWLIRLTHTSISSFQNLLSFHYYLPIRTV